jgi:hypothetical protein
MHSFVEQQEKRMTFAILWPSLFLAGLVFLVWGTLVVQRYRHIRSNPPSAADFASREAAMRYFQPVEMSGNNLANLFEMPVLYFALVPLLIVTKQAGDGQLVLAWLFVLLRAAHSAIHIGSRAAMPRFLVYLASCVVLFAMWLSFAIALVQAG